MKDSSALSFEQLEPRFLLSVGLLDGVWGRLEDGVGGDSVESPQQIVTVDPTAPVGSEALLEEPVLGVAGISLGEVEFVESGGLVVMEAENCTSQSAGTGSAEGLGWTATTDLPDYTGEAAMHTTGFNKNLGDTLDGPRMDYAIDFSQGGTYYVWVRMLGSSGSRDSLHVGLDGVAATLGRWGVTDKSRAWHWEDRISDNRGYDLIVLEVSEAGLHTLNVWMREAGTAVDRILLTTDSNYVPQGAGPAESPQKVVYRNRAPVAEDDSVLTMEDSPVAFSVLDNDTDADGDTLTVNDYTQAAHGVVSENVSGSFTYTPDENYYGDDSFTYTVSDGTNEDTASVNVTVSLDDPFA